jgi:valyl-tRNA synthetase
MLGDSAIAVHPDDPRYKVLLPFTLTVLEENNLRMIAPSGKICRSPVH